jgi:hypothetical protein
MVAVIVPVRTKFGVGNSALWSLAEARGDTGECEEVDHIVTDDDRPQPSGPLVEEAQQEAAEKREGEKAYASGAPYAERPRPSMSGQSTWKRLAKCRTQVSKSWPVRARPWNMKSGGAAGSPHSVTWISCPARL